ncbi:hypothetical protein KP2612_002992 [Komagataella phaffii]|uniref:MoaB/Mog domain-containing protein n=2 Tax=Komagataella phaffii TaxID=460519 RepID=C4QZE9_KOMPG|nr:uncharacterized protein PAS_chr2-1_0024 [Komagataella phaffii GS115]AOA62756.1 GQ67_00048T0 [Komagataella phaffii]AOA66950.1 GQ68_01339T0 [Komagataella phaffii GS115]CAY68623.1 Putative protein of unknown function [Komagataella phaffii GS115]
MLNSLRRMSIKSAGCIIIGDEVLNSKITDTNSRFFAKYCYDLGVDLRKISIISDEEDEIIATVKEFDSKFDFIVTSGGIGPTHDDITYSSIAKAYGLSLKHDQFAYDKCLEKIGDKIKFNTFTQEQIDANLRMFLLPYDPNDSNFVKTYYANDLWVPIVNINNKLNILPGIPRLFQELLTDGITPHVKPFVPKTKFLQYYVAARLPESQVAPLLGRLQKEVIEKGLSIKIGSYPHVEKRINTVCITGKEEENEVMRQLVATTIEELGGEEISKEEEEGHSHSHIKE